MTATETRTLLDIERRFWDAMQEKDGKTAGEMTDESCIVVGAQGVNRITPEAMDRMTREGPWQLTRYDLKDDTAQVRMLGDDVALVAYSVHEDVTMEGKPISMDAHEASVWVRRDGEWRCAMHIESLASDNSKQKNGDGASKR